MMGPRRQVERLRARPEPVGPAPAVPATARQTA
jgi:hypothetical protein